MLHLSPLARAAADGDAQAVVQLLANGASVGYMNPSEDGTTPLYLACEFGHAEVVAALLAANADANQARSDGVTPLRRANSAAVPTAWPIAKQGPLTRNEACPSGVVDAQVLLLLA